MPADTSVPPPTPPVEWRLSVFAPENDTEVAFLPLTDAQAAALGAQPDGMIRVEAYVGCWQITQAPKEDAHG